MTTIPTPSPEAEALPTLPVVAWRVEWAETDPRDPGNWVQWHDSEKPPDAWDDEEPTEMLALTPQAPAEAAIVALRAEVAELRKERDALIQAGAPMANTMFNLAQKFDPVLFTRRDCELFRIMQINWDAARATLLGDGGTL